MNNSIYSSILSNKKSGKKQLAVLLDPDKLKRDALAKTVALANKSEVDFIFVGGSLLVSQEFENTIIEIKKRTKIPVVIFPGSPLQISNQANAILFLSLISGRNADLLIGQQIVAAPYLKASSLEILPTGYMLIDSGKPTTAQYISNTLPIPADKPDIAACTALAGEMLGLKLIYLDGGSGAKNPVSAEMIRKVRQTISVPLIVGGGIKTPENAYAACKAGADIIVVGNAAEKDFSLIKKISYMFETNRMKEFT